MALAIRLETLVREGAVRNYGDLADAGQISRARMSQLLRLLELAPAIQEQLLFLPKIICGRDPIHEHALRKITRIVDWGRQIEAFRAFMAEQSKYLVEVESAMMDSPNGKGREVGTSAGVRNGAGESGVAVAEMSTWLRRTAFCVHTWPRNCDGQIWNGKR
jgi:hypothetical protein